VLSLVRFGQFCLPTRLVLQFSEPMDEASVERLDGYQLAGPLTCSHGKVTARPIKLRSATYDPQTMTVTLVPKPRLNLFRRFQITVLSGPDGVRDLAGNALDGNSDGLAGDNYFRRFGKEVWQRPTKQAATPSAVSLPLPARPMLSSWQRLHTLLSRGASAE
jgi:hypothetical protein